MITICDNINKYIGRQFTCTNFNGFIKVQTPYLYPDGDIIDVFVKSSDSGLILTDLGETIAWLSSHSISHSLSERKNQLIEDLIFMYQVERYKGMLIKKCDNSENLSFAIVDFCQAIIRVSDIYLTYSGKTSNSFYEDVADFLTEEKFEFQKNVKYVGTSERERIIDFEVIISNNISLIKGLNYHNKTEANSRSDIINSCWSDLGYIRMSNPNINFISLINDTEDKKIYPNNINLLQSVSSVAFWSNKNQLKNLIRR